MLPITVSYHLEELLKGSAFEGWADYVALTFIAVLLFIIRLFFFASSKIDISGKVALITGGGRGIGFMMAKKLALDHGCKVVFILNESVCRGVSALASRCSSQVVLWDLSQADLNSAQVGTIL
jgi:hypothetical protein